MRYRGAQGRRTCPSALCCGAKGWEPVPPPFGVVHMGVGGGLVAPSCAMVHMGGEPVPPPFAVAQRGREPVSLPRAVVHTGEETPPSCAKVNKGGDPVAPSRAVVHRGRAGGGGIEVRNFSQFSAISKFFAILRNFSQFSAIFRNFPSNFLTSRFSDCLPTLVQNSEKFFFYYASHSLMFPGH